MRTKAKTAGEVPADSFILNTEATTYAKLYKSVMSLLLLSYIQNWLM